jgi:hypothetical protein
MFFNVGAVIGAVVGAAVGIGLLAWNDWEHNRRLMKFTVTLGVLGYFGGLYLWGLAFDKDEAEPPQP